MTSKKKLAIFVPLGLVLVLFAWQGLRYLWLRGYSEGSRTGVIRKISVKGSPVCKYLSGEMVLIGSQPGQQPEVWKFTVYDDAKDNPLVVTLHDAERAARNVTVDYVENRGRWWQCADTNYYVVAVEK